MSSEARLKRTDAGLVADGEGWFVLNAREARWIEREGRGFNLPFTGWTEDEAETLFPQLGVALIVLEPGEPVGMYPWEAAAAPFLLLDGEALLIVEGEERPLRRWDFVHCPPGTGHIVIGAGDGRCVLLGIGAREHLGEDCNGGAYTIDEAAIRHGAGIESGSDADEPYARFAPSAPTPYREGWLPGP
ncbi:MAG: cupin domain-containing protein [Solirubrobacterales bacterium]